jgi:hypothetical protein
VRLTLTEPLKPDAYTLRIAPTVTATNSGLALDGEYFGQLPTGDGVPGGEAVLPLRVLAANGDINGDGCTDDSDLLAVLFAFGAQGARAEDVNGDNLVDDADLLQVLFALGERMLRESAGSVAPPADTESQLALNLPTICASPSTLFWLRRLFRASSTLRYDAPGSNPSESTASAYRVNTYRCNSPGGGSGPK